MSYHKICQVKFFIDKIVVQDTSPPNYHESVMISYDGFLFRNKHKCNDVLVTMILQGSRKLAENII